MVTAAAGLMGRGVWNLTRKVEKRHQGMQEGFKRMGIIPRNSPCSSIETASLCNISAGHFEGCRTPLKVLMSGLELCFSESTSMLGYLIPGDSIVLLLWWHSLPHSLGYCRADNKLVQTRAGSTRRTERTWEEPRLQVVDHGPNKHLWRPGMHAPGIL